MASVVKSTTIVIEVSAAEADVLVGLLDAEDKESIELRRANQWVYDFTSALEDAADV